MKKFTTIIAITLMMFLGSNVANAQQRGQRMAPQIPDATQITKMVGDLSKTLDLSDSKTKELTVIYTAHFKELLAKTKDSRPNRKDMQALKIKFEKEVKAILTPEQEKKYEVYLKEHAPKQRRQGNRQRR